MYIGIFLLLLMLALVALSIPIAFAIALASIIVIVVTGDLSLWNVVTKTYQGMNSFPLQAIPFFMFTGFMMNEAGVTERLIRLAMASVGWIRGGLAHVNIVVSLLFAGNSGSSTADASGVGSVLIPSMIKRGYTPELTVAVTSASATMAPIIPPSIMAVIYGSLMNLSVGKLFLAGVLPGILICFSQMALVYYYAIKNNIEPEKEFKVGEFISAFVGGIFSAGIPILVIGGILKGVFTSTEAGVVAALYTLILGTVYRTIGWKQILDVLERTAIFTALVLFCIGTATAFAHIIAFYKVPTLMESFVLSFATSKLSFMLFSMVIFLIIGCFMDTTPALVIMMPILGPIAANLKIDPILYGIVNMMTLAIGLISPPYGLSLLVSSRIAGISAESVIKQLLPFVISFIILIILIILLPDIALWLPNKFVK